MFFFVVAEYADQALGKFKVGYLKIATNVVCLANLAAMENNIQSVGYVGRVQIFSWVVAIAVYVTFSISK